MSSEARATTNPAGMMMLHKLLLSFLGASPVFGNVGEVVVVPVVVVAQVDTLTVVMFNVTAPFLASSLPLTFELPLSAMDVKAMMVPTKVEPVPSVAELVTCQKTLQA